MREARACLYVIRLGAMDTNINIYRSTMNSLLALTEGSITAAVARASSTTTIITIKTSLFNKTSSTNSFFWVRSSLLSV
jgi:hypothetical protein